MKKNVFGRQLKRDANERKALFKNLLTSLVMHERVKTTQAKAKAIRPAADKLVTRAKKGGVSAYRNLEPLVNHEAVVKLIGDIGPRFAQRQGGYTRIIRIGNRVADNAPMVLLEWTEKSTAVVVGKTDSKEKKEKKDTKEARVAVKTEKKQASTKTKTTKKSASSAKKAGKEKKK